MRIPQIPTLTITAGLLVATPALAQDPYTQPDDSWISISGTIESVRPNTFTLDYGDGVVTVEFDDGDRDADAYKLIPGDMVTVSGIVDDDLFETTTIEASSVYVENVGTRFHASAFDEEDAWYSVTVPVVVSQTLIEGDVTSVDRAEGEFTLDTGSKMVTVEVESMPYDPLDDEGYQKIRKGQRVSVSGDVDIDLFEGRVFEADAIVTLEKNDERKKAQDDQAEN